MTDLNTAADVNGVLDSFEIDQKLTTEELQNLQLLNDSVETNGIAKNTVKDRLEENFLDDFKVQKLIEKLEGDNDITENEVWEVFDINKDKKNDYWWKKEELIWFLQLYLKVIDCDDCAEQLQKQASANFTWIDGLAWFRTADALTEYAKREKIKQENASETKEEAMSLFVRVEDNDLSTNTIKSLATIKDVEGVKDKIISLQKDFQEFEDKWIDDDYKIADDKTLWDCLDDIQLKLDLLDNRKTEIENDQKARDFDVSKYELLGYKSFRKGFLYREEVFTLDAFIDGGETALKERYNEVSEEFDLDTQADNLVKKLLKDKPTKYKWLEYDHENDTFSVKWNDDLSPIHRNEILWENQEKLMKKWIEWKDVTLDQKAISLVEDLQEDYPWLKYDSDKDEFTYEDKNPLPLDEVINDENNRKIEQKNAIKDWINPKKEKPEVPEKPEKSQEEKANDLVAKLWEDYSSLKYDKDKKVFIYEKEEISVNEVINEDNNRPREQKNAIKDWIEWIENPKLEKIDKKANKLVDKLSDKYEWLEYKSDENVFVYDGTEIPVDDIIKDWNKHKEQKKLLEDLILPSEPENLNVLSEDLKAIIKGKLELTYEDWRIIYNNNKKDIFQLIDSNLVWADDQIKEKNLETWIEERKFIEDLEWIEWNRKEYSIKFFELMKEKNELISSNKDWNGDIIPFIHDEYYTWSKEPIKIFYRRFIDENRSGDNPEFQDRLKGLGIINSATFEENNKSLWEAFLNFCNEYLYMNDETSTWLQKELLNKSNSKDNKTKGENKLITEEDDELDDYYNAF